MSNSANNSNINRNSINNNASINNSNNNSSIINSSVNNSRNNIDLDEDTNNAILLSISEHQKLGDDLFKQLNKSKLTTNYKQNKLSKDDKKVFDANETDKTVMYNVIFKYFVNNYNQYTKLRNSYYDKIVEIDRDMNRMANEYKKLDDEYKNLNQEYSTVYKKNEINIVKEQKINKQKKLYFIMFVAQFLILCFLLLVIFELIPKYTGFLICIIIILVYGVYYFYEVYFNNINRNYNTRDKIYLPSNKSSNVNSICSPNNDQKIKKAKNIKNKVSKLLKSYKSKKCKD